MDADDDSPEKLRHAFYVLALLEKAGIPASRPLLLDAEGKLIGVPAMVMSYIPGRSFYHHPDEAAWVDGLARALAEIHRVTPQRFDLSRLPLSGSEPDRPDDHQGHLSKDMPLALQAFQTLLKHKPAILPLGPCLVHDDFWPGNTVWFRGRLVAVVDWASAAVGDPRNDVSQCRADLVFSNGLDTADAFLARYEAHAGPLRHMWYFDARLGLRALLNYPRWLPGYNDAGMTHLKLEDVGARIEAFLRRALDQAP
jgi:aminoglycoside phosphotransferase (APT) family kinase protein